ncbi:DUF6193 family natural product biosynthesis protein [Streptomyces sp. LaPpAH-108]|uniref:DUF6193 family natural product biosynthesis protein n=1 Tax=Streptomyces sp. LaPpAH-108 TaxID=1155714 RepID=UPI00036491DC|nr:DUF6193 family natural product biosynthesis protein [Streptomyces sp. LaPpAH-108]
MPPIDGNPDKPAQAARATRARRDETPQEDIRELEDIREAAPFMHPTGRSEAPDGDPARLTESEWHEIRREAAELDYLWQETCQNLIEAAYAEPALRALYPFTSHRALRFSTTTRPHLAITGPCLSANSDNTYGVGRGFTSQDLGQFTTAREAVEAAVHHLPPSPGPITLGI